jgi:hypothetical protein
VVALPCLIGVWALSGFYLSLGPSLAAQLIRSQNLLWGGVVIVLLFGPGVPVVLKVRNSSSSNVMLGGCVALFGGALITFVGIATRTSAVLLAGTAVAGLGWGPAFMGATARSSRWHVPTTARDSSPRSSRLAISRSAFPP